MSRDLFFAPADILLPEHADMHRWSVIACDQFTSDADYWRSVQDTVGDAPSTLRLMLPEFYLGKCDEAAATRGIQQTMHTYLDSGVSHRAAQPCARAAHAAERRCALRHRRRARP